jgi:hypothetical protein
VTHLLFALILLNCATLTALIGVQARLRRVERRSVMMALWMMRTIESLHDRDRRPTEPEAERFANALRETLIGAPEGTPR